MNTRSKTLGEGCPMTSRVVKSAFDQPDTMDIKQVERGWLVKWSDPIANNTWLRVELQSASRNLKGISYAEITFCVRSSTRSAAQAVYFIIRSSDESSEISFVLAEPLTFTGGWDTHSYLIDLENQLLPIVGVCSIGVQSASVLEIEFKDVLMALQTDAEVINFRPDTFPGTLCSPLYSPARTPIALILCIHNSIDFSLKCLRSVLETRSEGVTVVIVNDGSTSDASEVIEEMIDGYSGIIYIRDRIGSGYTKAVNRGILQVSADYYILLNSDTIVPEGWINRIVSPLKSCDVGIVGPFSNRATIQSLPLITQNGGWAENNMITPYNFPLFDKLLQIASEHFKIDPVPVRVVNGFCMAVRREVFEAIGVFDERFFATGYGEETDLQLRAVKAGFEFRIVPNLLVYHHGSASYERYDVKTYQDSAFKLVSLKFDAAILAAYNYSRKNLELFSGRDTIVSLMNFDSLLKLAPRGSPTLSDDDLNGFVQRLHKLILMLQDV